MSFFFLRMHQLLLLRHGRSGPNAFKDIRNLTLWGELQACSQ